MPRNTPVSFTDALSSTSYEQVLACEKGTTLSVFYSTIPRTFEWPCKRAAYYVFSSCEYGRKELWYLVIIFLPLILTAQWLGILFPKLIFGRYFVSPLSLRNEEINLRIWSLFAKEILLVTWRYFGILIALTENDMTCKILVHALNNCWFYWDVCVSMCLICTWLFGDVFFMILVVTGWSMVGGLPQLWWKSLE